MAHQSDTRPEYNTIIRCTPQLENAVKNDLTKLCGEIAAVGLISPDSASSLRNPHNDAVDRAARLVELVANRVRGDSRNFVLFIKVLNKRWMEYKSILLELEKVYRSLGTLLRVSVGLSEPQTLISAELGHN